MKRTKILIYSDLSKKSEVSITTGIEWAKKLNCDPVVFYIHKENSPANASLLFPEYQEKLAELLSVNSEFIEEKLKEQVAALSGNDKIETKVFYSESFSSFLKVVEEYKAKMLILSTVESEFDTFLGGQITEKLIRMLRIPILVLKDHPLATVESIITPFAFQGLSEDALAFSSLVSDTFDSKLSLIHVHDEKEEVQLEDIKLNAKESVHRDNIKLLIEKFRLKGNFNNITLARSEGPKKEELLNQIQKSDAELVIMGSSGKNGLERFYLGSYCEFILRNSQKAILITKKF